MGGVHDESARSVLENVGDQVDELINDAKYGFPGLGVVSSEEEAAFSSDGERKDFKDQMNVKFRMGRTMHGLCTVSNRTKRVIWLLGIV